MNRGEKVTILRLASGLYKIERDGQPSMIGHAASTVCALNMIVFQTEAGETPEYLEHKE